MRIERLKDKFKNVFKNKWHYYCMFLIGIVSLLFALYFSTNRNTHISYLDSTDNRILILVGTTDVKDMMTNYVDLNAIFDDEGNINLLLNNLEHDSESIELCLFIVTTYDYDWELEGDIQHLQGNKTDGSTSIDTSNRGKGEFFTAFQINVNEDQSSTEMIKIRIDKNDKHYKKDLVELITTPCIFAFDLKGDFYDANKTLDEIDYASRLSDKEMDEFIKNNIVVDNMSWNIDGIRIYPINLAITGEYICKNPREYFGNLKRHIAPANYREDLTGIVWDKNYGRFMPFIEYIDVEKYNRYGKVAAILYIVSATLVSFSVVELINKRKKG